MPKFKITAPDGQKYMVEAESEARALSGLKATLDAQGRRGKSDFGSVTTRNMSLGAQDLTNAGMSALVSQAPRLVGKDPGYGFGDAFRASRRVEKQRADEYAAEKPGRNLAAGLLGGVAMPGGAQIAKLATPVKSGLLGGLETMARGAGIGGAMGAAFGALTEPDDMAGGAVKGGTVGAVTGGVVPAVTSGISALAKPVVRAANKASKGQILSASREVSARLQKALQEDGFGIDKIRQIQTQWLKTGVTPQLLDIVGVNSKTGALLRGAANDGAGAKMAGQYAAKVKGGVQGKALDLTRKLTPDEPRNAAQIQASLKAQIKSTDDELYPKFKSDIVDVRDLGTSLSGDTGLGALKEARKIADARQDWGAVEEIDNLIRVRNDPDMVKAERGPGSVKAGTADLIRQQLRDSGDDAYRNSNTGMGGGLKQRADQLKQALLGVDGFAEATQESTALRNQLDAVDVGLSGRSKGPGQFAQEVGDLSVVGPRGPTTEPRDAMRVGMRTKLEEQIGGRPEDATSVINMLGTADTQNQNLGTAFGAEAADTYQGGLRNIIEQASNAKRIAPRDMAPDDGGGDPVPLSAWAAMATTVNKLRNGATLTDQERELILQQGLGDLNLDELEQILAHIKPPRASSAVSYGLTPTITQAQGY